MKVRVLGFVKLLLWIHISLESTGNIYSWDFIQISKWHPESASISWIIKTRLKIIFLDLSMAQVCVWHLLIEILMFPVTLKIPFVKHFMMIRFEKKIIDFLHYSKAILSVLVACIVDYCLDYYWLFQTKLLLLPSNWNLGQGYHPWKFVSKWGLFFYHSTNFFVINSCFWFDFIAILLWRTNIAAINRGEN